MKKKKILFLINDLSFFISHRLPIAENLLRNGFDVVIGYGELGRSKSKILEEKGFKVTFIPINRGSTNIFKELRSVYYIWSFFKKEVPDICHVITIKPYLYGGVISRLLAIPCLVSAVSGLGTIFINKNLKSKLLRFLLFPIFKIAFSHPNQKIILHNKEDESLLVKWGVLNQDNVKIINGSGVNIDNFKKIEEPSGVPVVSFAGRLIADKGINEFISAARILLSRDIKAKFYIAGDLDLHNPSGLKDISLKKINEERIVELLGFQKDIPLLFAKSHIICLPSYREGLPKTLIEAAAASRAIVTTNVPGCRDAIIPNKTGLLVPAKDSKKLADALEWLIKNPQQRIEMGKAGRKYAIKKFAIEIIVQNHFDIYQNLLSNRYT
jgi:glycosyltransferase involved in cell wall biosynthesis